MRKQTYASLLVMVLYSATFGQTARQSPLVITGQVLDENGRPVSGAAVSAHPDGGLRGRLPSTSSNARGEFTIEVYKTGKHLVTASKPADGYPSSFNPFYNPTEDLLVPVLVTEGQPAPFATVHLGPRAGRLTGRIVDAQTGIPVEGAQVTLCRAEAPKYCHRVPNAPRAGEFDSLVPSAPFTILVSARGYKDWYLAERVDQQPISLQVASGATRVVSISLGRLQAPGEATNPSVLDAPQILFPVNGAEFNHYPRTTRLEWSAVPGAASYTVELEVCQPGPANEIECQGPLLQMRGNPPLSGIEGTSYEFLFVGAQPGRWRVWGVDTKGRMGLKSPWSIFIYRQ